jgi:transglutaminase-like putative cysteine protease
MSTASGRTAPPAAAGAGWRLEYPLPPDADVHDELLTPGATLRSHWTRFAESLARLGPHEMARRWDLARRLLRENGVTWGRDYGDVSPLHGIVLGGGAHRMAVAVDVTAVD